MNLCVCGNAQISDNVEQPDEPPPRQGESVARPIILMRNTNEKGGQCTRILKNYLTLITWKYLNISFVQQIIGSFPYFPNVSIRRLCASAHTQVHLVTDWSLSWKCLLCTADTPPNVSFLQLLVGTPSGRPQISHVPMISFSSIPDQLQLDSMSISARFQVSFIR